MAIGAILFEEKEEWTTTIEGQALRDTMLSLSKMTPEVYTEWWSPMTASLIRSVHTDVWLAANKLLGSTWFLQTKPPPLRQDTAKTKVKATLGSRKVGFMAETIEVISSKTGIFITKAGVASGDSRNFQDVTKDMPRDQYTFFTIRSQQLKSEDGNRILQAIGQFYEMLTHLWKSDPSFICYVFPSKAWKHPKSKPLTRKMPWVTARDQIEMYLKSLYLWDGQRAWFHIYAGHNKPREIFFEDDFQQELIEHDISLIKNSIQAVTTAAAAGYLVGSHVPRL